MSDTSENSSILPQWAETTFDKLRRGTMRNLEPPKINNVSNIFFDDSDSTSIQNHSNSIARDPPSVIIFSPKLKAPKRVYANTRKQNNWKSPKSNNYKHKKLKKSKPSAIESFNEKSTLPEDNVLLHELVIESDRTELPAILNSSSSIMATPKFKNRLLTTSTPVTTTKSFQFNNNNNLPDLSAVENISEPKLQDKFHLKCQVVLPRLENVPIPYVRLNRNDINNYINKNTTESNALPIVRLERLNIDKFLQNQSHHSLSVIENSVSLRNSFKLRIKFKSTKRLIKDIRHKAKLHLISKSFNTTSKNNHNNITKLHYKKQNITLDPQLLVLCRRLTQQQIEILTNSKLNSSLINSTLNQHPDQTIQNVIRKSNHSESINNLNGKSLLKPSEEEFVSIKKSLINKRRGAQRVSSKSDKFQKQIIDNHLIYNNNDLIDLTNDANDDDDLVSGCELIDNDIINISSSTESPNTSLKNNDSIKTKLKTPNNLHRQILLHNFTNNFRTTSTPIKCNESSIIDPLSHHNSSSIVVIESPTTTAPAPLLPDKIFLKPGKHWQRSLSILRHTIAFKNPNDFISTINHQKKGRKWRSTIFQVTNDNKSICLNPLAPNSSQTKNIDGVELLNETQPNLNESIPGKRASIRIVPAIIPSTRLSQKDHFDRIGDDEHSTTKRSDLEIYARITQNFERSATGYVSKVGQNQIKDLGSVLNDLSLDINNQSTAFNESVLEPSLIRSESSLNVSEYSHCITAQDIVLKRCKQADPFDFDRCYPDSVLQKCHKIGEGVYGEVFLLKNANGSATVLKIIPIEGSLIVNGEHQKKFDEIISEIVIAQELSALRDNKLNGTECYAFVQNVRCIRGKYPSLLIDLWELYDEVKGSENEHPGIFDDDQLYIVFELEHGGRDLESFEFLNAEQAYSIFIQTALALSIGEKVLEFEHRDLHWGNLLIKATNKKTIDFKLDGNIVKVNTYGVKATIIDFTLSRVTYNNVCIYYNLADDPDLFKSVGDYQFEIYKLMQQKNQNQWEHFEPYTNVLWLHYVILKMIDGARYKRTKSLKHSKNIQLMQTVADSLLTQSSTEEFVQQFYYQQQNQYTKTTITAAF